MYHQTTSLGSLCAVFTVFLVFLCVCMAASLYVHQRRRRRIIAVSDSRPKAGFLLLAAENPPTQTVLTIETHRLVDAENVSAWTT